MNGGLFITLYDDRTLALYLKYGIYGFLMPPIMTPSPSPYSRHYNVLADYACSRQGTHIFFFLKRRIIYGGVVKGNAEIASFYLNGKTSPLGRVANAELFWDESQRYIPTEQEGIFKVRGKDRAQPFILQFEKNDIVTGKQISSDDLYFELGKYPYPLPSNTIQGMGFCTLTPGESSIAYKLLSQSEIKFNVASDETMIVGQHQQLFDSAHLPEDNVYQNEAHIEFSLLADIAPIKHLFPKDDYILCRQVPISPFKPANMDRADMCLYGLSNRLGEGTIPNIIIELKRDQANFNAYNQVVRYLRWLEKITSKEGFAKIQAYIIAPNFSINKKKIDARYIEKIKLYSIMSKDFQQIT
ncbi:MAG: hypothetical protein PHV77_05810 [Candidatus Omnitrophica bacterium]|jgi:hypothetical protein|nr:hypothetical protein [Candidatus Omnitrophota bacterium]